RAEHRRGQHDQRAQRIENAAALHASPCCGLGVTTWMKETCDVKRIAILSVLVLTTSCAVREANLRTFDNQRPPTNIERSAILDDIRRTFLDPYSVRDAAISNAASSMAI